MYLSAYSVRILALVFPSRKREEISLTSSEEIFVLPRVSANTMHGVIICTTYLRDVLVPIVAKWAKAGSSISILSVAHLIAII